MKEQIRVLIATAVFCCVPVARVSAQEGDDANADTNSRSALHDTRARGLYDAGAAAVEEGDFESAYRYFNEAYTLSHRPELLFNRAHAAERLRLDDEAVALFREFLEAQPDAPNRPYVEGRIRALERTIAAARAEREAEQAEAETEAALGVEEEAGAVEGPDVAALPPPPPETGRSPAGWVIAGAGGALLVAGAVLTGVGFAKRSSVDDAPRGSSWTEFEGDHDLANALTPTGIALLAVGAVGAGVGIAIAISGGGDEGVALRVGPAALALEGRFR